MKQNGFRLAFDKQEAAKEIYGGWEEPSGYRIELAFLLTMQFGTNTIIFKIL
ncbi:hypothetical protein KO561_19715 [Radiobacillus kanasensis]|uniref:hypothetical protein n=1 Tax=Radiobacillus kanasensis TaxID=2844358 RepID=UPI001E32D4D9|nr:hypothetical protein [Radiobacillus kanasensis]UFT99366.1 hypothetical protein KO561_19715 [Radiobacillus kanasensis]